MPKGLKPVRKRLATGEVRLYWYHRATGKRLEHDPMSAKGHVEIAALDEEAKGLESVAGHAAGSFASLWAEYRDSPEWRALKPRTRSDYQAVRDWLADAADKAIVRMITSAQILRLRDKAAGARGRRFGNYVLQVMRLVLEWGRPRGWCIENVARGVKAIRKPSGEARVNRAWTAEEIEAFTAAAPTQLITPFALGLFAGMRQGDALIATWAAYDGSAIRWIAGKNGEPCTAPVTGAFRAILEDAKRCRGDVVQIAVTSTGTPWTESGFRASFFKLVKKLEAANALRPGCTFHGLRHTIGSLAREGQESEWRIAAAIGDRTTKMAEIYGRDADRNRAQTEVLGDVQKRFANIDWKPRLETASGPPRRPRSKPVAK